MLRFRQVLGSLLKFSSTMDRVKENGGASFFHLQTHCACVHCIAYLSSFAQTASIGCVSQYSSMGAWRIVTDRPDKGEGIDCTYEFTVFFSSIQTNLVTAKNSGVRYLIILILIDSCTDSASSSKLQSVQYHSGRSSWWNPH